MHKRKERNPQDETTDKFIRVNRQPYATIKLKKDRNRRIIYVPIISNASPSISLTTEARSQIGSDTEESNTKPVEYEQIKLEYQISKREVQTVTILDAKSSNQFYKSCLTKKELTKFITD